MIQLSPFIPTFNVDAPPPTTERYNRGLDTKVVGGKTSPVQVGLYAIDNAILTHLQKNIRPIVTQDQKQIKLPVIYGNPEDWKSVQQDGGIRDKNGKILLPIMMIRRNSLEKNAINSPVNKYQTYTFKTRWNSRNVYDRFTVQNRITPSEQLHVTYIPDHYDVTYEAMIWTEYMEQMNKIVETVSFESNEYWGNEFGYRFLCRIDNIEQITDLPTTGDRMVRSKFDINMRAYILPDRALDRAGNMGATTKMQYSPKKVVFATEIEQTGLS